MLRIFLIFSTIFLLNASILKAEDIKNIYSVESVLVNVDSENPTKARDLGVKTARKDAFLILLARMNIDLNVAEGLEEDEISSMVESEQITNEKIAGKNYSALFNIAFSKGSVEHILKQKDVKKTPSKITPYLLIPAKKIDDKIVLWQESNDWKKAVQRTLDKEVEKKFFVPDSNLENIAVVNDENVENITYDNLEPLIHRYNISTSYILLFSFDEIENKAIIEVTQLNKLQKNQSRLHFVNTNRLSYQEMLDKVSSKVLEHLLKLQLEESKTANSYRIEIVNDELDNFLMIKNRIENSNLVDQLVLESISKDGAVIKINYINPNFSIEESFAKIGIILINQGNKYYKILL